jgi:hypothetical protein
MPSSGTSGAEFSVNPVKTIDQIASKVIRFLASWGALFLTVSSMNASTTASFLCIRRSMMSILEDETAPLCLALQSCDLLLSFPPDDGRESVLIGEKVIRTLVDPDFGLCHDKNFFEESLQIAILNVVKKLLQPSFLSVDGKVCTYILITSLIA